MGTTNYFDTFITASPDCPVEAGVRPPKPDSIAGLQYALLAQAPYQLTSDDLLFEVHRRRAGLAEAELGEAREAFFAKSQACLRASPLVKQFGWGVHHNDAGRIALYSLGSQDYARLAADATLKVVPGMRSRRA